MQYHVLFTYCLLMIRRWPFKLAIPVVGLAAAIPGYMLNSALRSALVLGHHARTSSYLAAMGLPSITLAISHTTVRQSVTYTKYTHYSQHGELTSVNKLADSIERFLLRVFIGHYDRHFATKDLMSRLRSS